jgi:ATP-binding cassette subfamily B protein
MSFVTAVLMAYEPAKRLAKMRVKIEIGMRRVRMMYEIIDLPVNLVEKKDAVDIPSGSGDIEFKDVTFGYGDQTPIIQNLNLNLKAGQTTALVGPSGGGKSTIMNLIMRLHDPLSGSVSIADIDLKDATFQSIRNQIAFIGQDTFLFSGTVRDNISLGRQNATEDEIVAAAKAANAHDFILRLGEQYDTDVGENGGNLSGGQRQRIAIARAILRDSPILLMDEATSALDSESEYQVKEALDKAAKGRSMIIIAHRLSTILSADRIVVINAGRVEEDGNLEELLQRNGLFRKLYDHQFDVAEPF